MSAINVLTFTKYSGYDPEARSDTNRGGGGSTFYSAPPAKTVTLVLMLIFKTKQMKNLKYLILTISSLFC